MIEETSPQSGSVPTASDAFVPSPYDDCDPERDDDEEDLDDCRMMESGQCMLAGTEWCDWKCPLGHVRGTR